MAPLCGVFAFSTLLNVDAIDLAVTQGYMLRLKCDADVEFAVGSCIIILFTTIWLLTAICCGRNESVTFSNTPFTQRGAELLKLFQS